MNEQDLNTNSVIDHIDPRQIPSETESDELERPRPRRKIDCAGNPEITDRRHIARGKGSKRDQQ